MEVIEGKLNSCIARRVSSLNGDVPLESRQVRVRVRNKQASRKTARRGNKLQGRKKQFEGKDK